MREMSDFRAPLMRLLQRENLEHWNLFESRTARADEVGILYSRDQWIVYSTDERANTLYIENYARENEEAAVSDFLTKLRATNRYFAAVKRERTEADPAEDA